MDHGKVYIEQAYLQSLESDFRVQFQNTHQLWVSMDNLSNALPRERLFSETPLDIVEDLCVKCVRLVQDVPQVEIRRPEAVAKVLRKDPTAI